MVGGNKKAYLVSFLVQAIYSVMVLLSKAAFNRGMNHFVFVFYRQAFATVCLVPCAVLFEGKRAPPLSLRDFCKIFMLSLFGITLVLNTSAIALVYTSSALVAATSNAIPVFTFIFAVMLRLECLKLRTLSGIAKVVGAVLCMAGAAVLAFYKGPNLKPIFHHHPFDHPSHHSHISSASSSNAWLKGCFLMLFSNILWALWLILQAGVLKSFPSKLIFTSLQCLLSTSQTFIVAIIFERNIHQWKLHLDLGLIAVCYAGVMVTGVTFFLIAWCVEKKGPVFLAMSTPWCLIITIICSSLLFGEVVTLGSVVGGLVLVGGLYSVLWGKNMEERSSDKLLKINEDATKVEENQQDEIEHEEIIRTAVV